MSALTRRAALQASGVAFASGLAGCSVFSRSSGTPRLGMLRVMNHDTRPHTVHILFEDEDPVDPMYWASREVASAEDGVVKTAYFNGFPTDPGQSVLHVRADNQPQSEWKRFSIRKADVSCIGLTVAIGAADQPGDDLTVWETINPHTCEKESTTNR